MALTAKEKERVRYHLGYLQVEPAASLTAGTPRPIQTLFLVESAMENILAEAEFRVRKLLDTLDRIEKQIEAATCQLAVEQLGEMKLRGAKAGETYPDLLEREYRRWAFRLADVLGVPIYPYALRFKGSGGIQNVRVR